MNRTAQRLWVFIPAAFLILLCFAAFAQPVSAAAATDIKYSPLFEASLADSIREFDEKESGEYFSRTNDAVTEKADRADGGDKFSEVLIGMSIPGVPTIPTVPTVPTVPSYTSSYSCGATCGATCGSTCGSTCVGSSTCVGTSTCAGSSTCFGSSSCTGSSTCAGSSTCQGSSTCYNSSTCIGTSTCVGTSTCAGSSTCIGSNTCSPVGASGCVVTPSGGGSSGGSSSGGGSSGGDSGGGSSGGDPLPETPVNSREPSSWAEKQVKEAIEYGFVPEGLQDNYQSNMTRKEFCELTIQFLKGVLAIDSQFDGLLDDSPGASPFTDVDNASVTWAYHLDIVNGVGNGKFDPYGQITRQEAAAMLTNLAKNVFEMDTTANDANFSDSSDIESWAKSAVDFVNCREVMSGIGNGKFAPREPYTREQSIVTILRIFNAALEEA